MRCVRFSVHPFLHDPIEQFASRDSKDKKNSQVICQNYSTRIIDFYFGKNFETKIQYLQVHDNVEHIPVVKQFH